MDVGRDAAIHGISASTLKALLSKRDGRFTTPQAMGNLDLVEPAATDAMFGLARDGYLEFAGRPDGIDIWEAGKAGHRLMASRIQKRFPAREGRRIADAVVAAARDANADAGSPVRVIWIAVFGSMLDAEDDDLVGDVDLIVRVRRRHLPKDELRRLEQIRLATAPPSGRDRLAPYWSRISLLRRLGQVSSKASLMDESTLDLGVRHRPIYAYDVRKETEVGRQDEQGGVGRRRSHAQGQADRDSPSRAAVAGRPGASTAPSCLPRATEAGPTCRSSSNGKKAPSIETSTDGAGATQPVRTNPLRSTLASSAGRPLGAMSSLTSRHRVRSNDRRM